MLVFAAWATSLSAQTVSLDPTFGKNGMTVLTIEGEIRYLEFDKKENIIAVGRDDDYSYIVKTDADGFVDKSFGSEGIVRLPDNFSPHGLKITNENKYLVLVGYPASQVYQLLYLFQFNENGSIDESFGSNGKISVNTSSEQLCVANLESDDFMLLILGYFIRKYNYKGELDDNFSNNRILTDDETYRIAPRCMKVLNDQSILIAGYDFLNTEKELGMIKLTPDGHLDTSFATRGIWKKNIFADEDGVAFCGWEDITDIIEDSKGNPIVLCTTFGTLYAPFSCIINLFSDGTINPHFGMNGFYYHYYSDTNRLHSKQKILQNGNKYIACLNNVMTTNKARIICVNDNGILDLTFNNTGVFNCEDYTALIIKQQETNKFILGGGYGTRWNSTKSSIVRIHIPSGVSIKTFLPNEKSTFFFPNPIKDILYLGIEKRFEIMDIQGKVLFRSEKAVLFTNVSHLKAGIYFIKFEDGSVGKFVKE